METKIKENNNHPIWKKVSSLYQKLIPTNLFQNIYSLFLLRKISKQINHNCSIMKIIHNNLNKVKSSQEEKFENKLNQFTSELINIYSINNSVLINTPLLLKEYLLYPFHTMGLRILSDISIYNKLLNQTNKEKIEKLLDQLSYPKTESVNESILSQNKIKNNLSEDTDSKYTSEIYCLNNNLKNKFDFDIIFVNGLNSYFLNSWRMPLKEISMSLFTKLKIYFKYLYSGNENILFPLYKPKTYKQWISILLENGVFKGYNIRYLAISNETRIFKYQLTEDKIKDCSINEISKRYLDSLRIANCLKKPTIFIGHSLGGILIKKIISKMTKKEKQSIKGIIFMSTPHFGSQNLIRIIPKIRSKLFNFLNLFNENLSVIENSLFEDDFDIDTKKYFSKIAKELNYKPKKYFLKDHILLKKNKIKYISINENSKTLVTQINGYINFVDPININLKGSRNYSINNKNHYSLIKYNNENDEALQIIIQFIKENFHFPL